MFTCFPLYLSGCSLLSLISAAAVKRTSVEELSPVSQESWITPIMKPTPTTCIAISDGTPNKLHAIGISNKEPPATPDAPAALSAASTQRMRAVPKSTSIPTVYARYKPGDC